MTTTMYGVDPEEINGIIADLKVRADKMPVKNEAGYRAWTQTFKDEIRALHKKTGLGHYAIGKQLDISPSQVKRWIDGKREPKRAKAASKKPSKPPARPSKPPTKPKPNGVKNGVNKYTAPGAKASPPPVDTSALALLVLPPAMSPDAHIATIAIDAMMKIGAALRTGYPDLDDEEELNRQLKENGADLLRYGGTIKAMLTPPAAA